MGRRYERENRKKMRGKIGRKYERKNMKKR